MIEPLLKKKSLAVGRAGTDGIEARLAGKVHHVRHAALRQQYGPIEVTELAKNGIGRK